MRKTLSHWEKKNQRLNNHKVIHNSLNINNIYLFLIFILIYINFSKIDCFKERNFQNLKVNDYNVGVNRVQASELRDEKNDLTYVLNNFSVKICVLHKSSYQNNSGITYRGAPTSKTIQKCAWDRDESQSKFEEVVKKVVGNSLCKNLVRFLEISQNTRIIYFPNKRKVQYFVCDQCLYEYS